MSQPLWTVISDHIERAKERLLEQYKNKPRIAGMFEATIQQIQDLEDAFNALSQETIDTAVGVQLDRLGEIVGLARETGQSDDDYRIDLKAKIVQNLNQGTPEEVIAAAKFFIGASFVWYLEVYPAAVDIMSSTPIDPALVAKIRSKLKGFLPAGVSLDVLGFFPEEDAFRFNEAPGFGDVNDPDLGGLLAEIYT